MKRILVLGGGISGLTAARAIQDTGQSCVLLEQSPTVGGLTRTVNVGDFCFDYTGHFLHLTRYRTPADIPFAALHNDQWEMVNRRSCCFVSGRLVTAPIQYNLAGLPPSDLAACLCSYAQRGPLPALDQATFRDYIVSGFGQYLADLFLIPQNEKTMAIALDRLSLDAVKRFFPPPNDAAVLAGATGQASLRADYNSHFWYPTIGGIERLVAGLAAGLANVRTNQQVTSLNLPERTLRTSAGDTFEWDLLFSSIPLNSFCQCSDDSDLRFAASRLSHSSTVSFNIGMRGRLRPEFEGVHWVYVPDRSIPFYRVGFYSQIGRGSCSPNNSSMYVEVGVPGEQLKTVDLVKTLQPRVIASLEELGWLDSRAIVCIVINIIDHAYVHHTRSRDTLIESIRARLDEANVHTVGRYGLWDYTSMEDSMESARLTVREALR